MAERSSGGSGFPVVLNSLLLIFTLVGCALLVSKRLTSDRPVTPTGKSSGAIGGQTLQARLWEDPFHPVEEGQERSGLPDLTDEIAAHKADGDQVLLLPVMIPGGPYGEDQESRIRSRFAIVSALGQSGYAPEDAEHIGAVEMKWPTTQELERWKKNTNATLDVIGKYAAITTNSITLRSVSIDQNDITNLTLHNVVLSHSATRISTTNAAIGSVDFHIRYEWYQPRVFDPHSKAATIQTNVLVLWLDDSFFEDEPLLRLPLFLAPLINAADSNTNSSGEIVRLIGPRRSATLRAMLPDEFAKSNHVSFAITNAPLWLQATQTLGRIALYSATANVMDEVLVTNAYLKKPREVVCDKLKGMGFRAAHFFNASDAQMAVEILDELKLRHVDLTNQTYHLVLLSEWDTFYGRMLSLTYGATLALQQRINTNTPYSNITNLTQFVNEYRAGTNLPANFHNFVYLRGLDGQTVGNGEAAGDKSKTAERVRPKPGSLEDLIRWTPDANKAEGPGQFDYLSRTGDWIASLQQELKLSNRGEIKAVGIVGSDVYDILLILQALRSRFPEILFFTTDLDARFWHPDEREWSRNLIVASSYGLTLHRNLQQDVAPFRDSSQTAQFVAALSALGNADLTNFVYGGVRRFEIGNRAAVDLSVTNHHLAIRTNAWLHPLTVSENHREHPEYSWRTPVKLGLGMLVCAVALAVYFIWNPFRNRSKNECGYLSQHLPFTDADVGGPMGAKELLVRIQRTTDPFCVWINNKLSLRHPEFFPAPAPDLPGQPGMNYDLSPVNVHFAGRVSKEYEIDKQTAKKKAQAKNDEQRADALVDLLNNILCHVTRVSVRRSNLVNRQWARKASPWQPAYTRRLQGPWRLYQRFQTRRLLDDFLTKVASIPTPPIIPTIGLQILRVAADARKSARKLFWVRLRFAFALVIAVLVIGLVALSMGFAIWNDTYTQANGEPFSLTAGTSAWPNVILRGLSTSVAIFFCYVLIEQLRSTYYNLTRRYRFRLTSRNGHNKPQHVCASKMWHELHRTGHPCWRCIRAIVPCLLYFFFALSLFMLLGSQLFEPFRGDAVKWWSDCFCHFFGSKDAADHFQILLYFCSNIFVLSFLFLSFLTIDAAVRCRSFINSLSARPTDYPTTTRAHFQSERGDVDAEYLDEWIDTQLIADFTEQVQRLLWFPGIVFLLMLASRNEWTDNWPTSNGLLIILILNFAISITSIVILQYSAKRAKKQAIASLSAKLKKAQSLIALSPQHNNAERAKELLDEISNLNRGAYVGFWENPVLGAVFLAPGGTVLIQLLAWLSSR